MPIAQIRNPQGAYGQPLFTGAGNNDQLLVECVNNTGMPIYQGMVMCWDVAAALNTTPALLISAPATGTVAAQTLTAASSTAGYTPGSLMTISNVQYAATGCGPLNNYVGQMAAFFGAITGSTFTGAQLPFATKTNGLTATSAFFMAPSASVSQPQGVGLPAIGVNSGSGRYCTFSGLVNTAVLGAKDPLVCGVVSPTGDSGTNGTLILPGNPFLMCVAGIARVFIGGGTVAANAALCTGALQVGGADDATPTLGNQLGTSLEANTAKDSQNGIRAIIKVA